MTNPPATCPACGAGLRQPATANEAFYGCGAYCCTVEFGKPDEWIFTKNWECRNAFDVAVRLRAENERLKAQLAKSHEAIGKLHSDIEYLISEVECRKAELDKWQNWQPDDEGLREMKQQAQGGDGTYTDSLAANSVYIHGLEARIRVQLEDIYRIKRQLELCRKAFDELDTQPEETKD